MSQVMNLGICVTTLFVFLPLGGFKKLPIITPPPFVPPFSHSLITATLLQKWNCLTLTSIASSLRVFVASSRCFSFLFFFSTSEFFDNLVNLQSLSSTVTVQQRQQQQPKGCSSAANANSKVRGKAPNFGMGADFSLH